MKRYLWFAAVVLLSVRGFGADLFDIKPMADGIYAALSKPAYKINCNAAIILLDDSVLVVDTHSKPSAARELIVEIKKLTDKPVRWVVNTHFHWDHFQGNQAYLNAWPAGLEIIASETTRQNMERRGIRRVKYQLLDPPKDIARIQSELALTNDAAKKTELTGNLREADAYY